MGLPAAPKKPQPPTLHPSTRGTPSAPVPTRTATTITITGGVITMQQRITDEEGVAEETLIYNFYDSLPALIGPQDPERKVIPMSFRQITMAATAES